MFYDLIIHPSRIEFIHRVFSPEKNGFDEKKLESSDLNFRFDPSMLDKGDHYTNFRQAIKDITKSYSNEFNSINVIISSSFFQTKSISCDQRKADYSEYINWEAYQMTTDQPENYRYGNMFLEHERKLLIVLVRKKVYDYFTTLIHEIYAGQVECKLGCACPLPDYKEITVYADKQLLKPFRQTAYEHSTAPVSDEISAPVRAVRSAAFILVLLFLFILSVSVSLIYFAPDFTRQNLEKLTSFIPSSSGTQQVQVQPLTTSVKQADTLLTETKTSLPADSVVTDSIAAVSSPAIIDSAKINVAETVKPVIKKPAVEKPKETPPAEEPEKTPAVTVDPALDPHPEFWDYMVTLSQVKADSIVFVNGSGNGEINIYSFEDNVLNKAKDISVRFDPEITFNLEKSVVKDDSFSFINSRKRSNYNRFLEVKSNLGIKSRAEFPNVFRFPSIDKLHEFFKGFNDNNVGFKKFIIEYSQEFITFTVYFG